LKCPFLEVRECVRDPISMLSISDIKILNENISEAIIGNNGSIMDINKIKYIHIDNIKKIQYIHI